MKHNIDMKHPFSKIKRNLPKAKKHPKSSKSHKPMLAPMIKKLQKQFLVDQPRTAQQFATMLFQDIDPDTDIFRIDENTYSFCMEYDDISFSKASLESQVDTFTSWVKYLNSFTEHTHIQVVHSGTSTKTEEFKQGFYFKEQKDANLSKMAKEFNKRIDLHIGEQENTLEHKRYLVVSQKAKSFQDAKQKFLDILNKTEDKFKLLKSSIRIVPYAERLNMIYDLLHLDIAADHDCVDLLDEAKRTDKTIYDLLVPEGEQAISFQDKKYVMIMNQKFIQILYANKYPKSLTPKFYHDITSQDMNMITTLNIQPMNNAKIKKKIDKKLSGMDTEKYDKIQRHAGKGVSYHDIPDRKLEARIRDAETLRNDMQKNSQKIFQNNLLICIMADSLEELESNRNILTEVAAEHFVELKPILWQQAEGIQHVLPLGHNRIQFQRTLTSEATAVNVPFDAKDLMQKTGLYYGQNLSTKQCLFADRKKLMNGNGAVLATSGAGKSFEMKLLMEQIKCKYPEDDIIVIDPQNEYIPVSEACKGQTIELSQSSKTYINPFDLDIHYSLSDGQKSDPIKEKIEYILSFIESLLDVPLSGVYKTLIDRCCNLVYAPYVASNYQDESVLPKLPEFYECMKQQPEIAAGEIAVVLERYVNGSIDMFSYSTNINIKNKFVCFDISNLPKSMQTTGYLVVLDHIMNRLAKNKVEGRFTWIFIDEFHLLLKNPYSAEYISKIYKIGRKFHALPTICTQNITNVLQSDYGCDILSNSESAIILKQKPLDLRVLSQIFDISESEQEYVINSPNGQGLLIFGEDCYPFRNEIPKEYYLYQLNETSSLQKARV